MNRYYVIVFSLLALGISAEFLINRNLLGGATVMTLSFLAGLSISKKAEEWHPIQCLIPVVLIIITVGYISKNITGNTLSVIGCEIACINTFLGLGYYKLKADKFM